MAGADDEARPHRDLARLLEEAEGEARRDAADRQILGRAWRGASMRGHLRGLRADLEEEAALSAGWPAREVFHLDGVARHAPLVIEASIRTRWGRPAWAPERRRDGEVPRESSLMRAAHDDGCEGACREQQIEEVIAGVDGGKPTPGNDADEELPS